MNTCLSRSEGSRCIHVWYIYSFLIEKDVCDCCNISIRFPWDCARLSSRDFFILSVRVSTTKLLLPNNTNLCNFLRYFHLILPIFRLILLSFFFTRRVICCNCTWYGILCIGSKLLWQILHCTWDGILCIGSKLLWQILHCAWDGILCIGSKLLWQILHCTWEREANK